MIETSTPFVDVTIGDETRIYEAFITTAPVAFDRPSTLTLYESSFSYVAGLAANPIPFDQERGRTPARVVLIASKDRLYQRALYREGHHLLMPADPILVGRNTLQDLLWQRLGLASACEVH
jgi:hypothetical protein